MINNIVKKIVIMFSIILILLTNKVGAYYHYENRFTVFQLNRNSVPANYSISYDKNTITNQDVEVRINFDKAISILGDNKGLELSSDRKSLFKLLSNNETNQLLIRDDDFNYKEIQYNVNWIDKEPPVITGAEQGKTYQSNVHLNYTDNYQIAEIYSDYYSDSFSIYSDSQDFYEIDTMQIVPATKNSITVYVLSNKKEMEMYNYYMDDVLYATTHDKKYTFNNLELSETQHHFVVEALDRYGNVLESKETYRKTIPIERVDFALDNGIKYIALKGTPDGLTKISAYVWVDEHYNDTVCNLGLLHDSANSYVISILMSRHKNYSGKYIVKFEMEYTENGENKQATIIGSVYMPNKYKALNYTGLPNDFVENGNYYLRCTDEAGNETELDFAVKK